MQELTCRWQSRPLLGCLKYWSAMCCTHRASRNYGRWCWLLPGV